MKKTQMVMVWFLPLIVIGGLFEPRLGYLVVAMMAFFLTLSFFKARYWCWNLCPRGAFLDIVMPKFSMKRPLPMVFIKEWFRTVIFALFMGFVVLRILRSGGDLLVIGSLFVGMCLLTTAIAVILGAFSKYRGWCVICPMGFLQEKIGRIRSGRVQRRRPN